MKRDVTIIHMIKVNKTKDGGHYAACSCGWRSFGQTKRASAESAASDHAKAIPPRRGPLRVEIIAEFERRKAT